jgi:putative transposase
MLIRAYRLRLEPTAAQDRQLRQFAGARRFIWNWALQRREHYQQMGKTLPAKELSARLTALKAQPETAWLREMDSQLLQQALADVQRAFVNFVERRARYPRFKSRKRDRARFRIPQRVRLHGQRVYVPKIGLVRARVSRPVAGQTKSATFTQDAGRHGHVALVAQTVLPGMALPLPTPEHSVGLDVGLADAVVCSDGTREPAPRFYRGSHGEPKRLWTGCKTCDEGNPGRSKNPRALARGVSKWSGQSRG